MLYFSNGKGKKIAYKDEFFNTFERDKNITFNLKFSFSPPEYKKRHLTKKPDVFPIFLNDS